MRPRLTRADLAVREVVVSVALLSAVGGRFEVSEGSIVLSPKKESSDQSATILQDTTFARKTVQGRAEKRPVDDVRDACDQVFQPQYQYQG